jgi:hypothetical protein
MREQAVGHALPGGPPCGEACRGGGQRMCPRKKKVGEKLAGGTLSSIFQNMLFYGSLFGNLIHASLI